MIGIGQLVAQLFGGMSPQGGLPSGITVSGPALGGFNPSPLTPGITASGEAGPLPPGVSVSGVGTSVGMPRTTDLLGALGGIQRAATPAAQGESTFAPWGRRRSTPPPIAMRTAAQLFR